MIERRDRREMTTIEKEAKAEKERFRRLGILVFLRNAQKPFLGITPEMDIEERLRIVEDNFEEFKKFVRQGGNFSFAFHGSGPRDIDFDARTTKWFLQLAGIKIDDCLYLEAGRRPARDRINIDVGGGLGISIPHGWKSSERTVIIEHHPRMGESPSFSVDEYQYVLTTSAAEQIYKMLEALDLFEGKDIEALKKMAEFVTQMDNKTHPQQFNRQTFEESWQTMMGLYYYISPEKLYELFRAGVKPTDRLFDGHNENWVKEDWQKLSRLGLIYKLKNGQIVNRPAQRKEMIEESLAEVKRKVKNGMVVEIKIGERNLKFIVDYIADIDPKGSRGIPLRSDAVIASGYDGVILYNEKTESYFINLDPRLKEELAIYTKDGVNVRGKMFIKDINQLGPLRISLAELIRRLGGDLNKVRGGLREAIKNNEEWIETEIVNVDGSQIQWFEGKEGKPGHWGLPSGGGRKHGIITDGLPQDFNPQNEKGTKIQLRVYKDTKPDNQRAGALLLKVIQIIRKEDEEKSRERITEKIYVVPVSFSSGCWEAILPNGQKVKLPENPEGYDSRFLYRIKVVKLDSDEKLVAREVEKTNQMTEEAKRTIFG